MLSSNLIELLGRLCQLKNEVLLICVFDLKAR